MSVTKSHAKSKTKKPTKKSVKKPTKKEVKKPTKKSVKKSIKKEVKKSIKKEVKKTEPKTLSEHSDVYSEAESGGSTESPVKIKLRKQLKRNINQWFDTDDKIKRLSQLSLEYKHEKKDLEPIIMKNMKTLKLNTKKLDITDDKNNMRGRVYIYKSVTKGGMKEEHVKKTLMETLRDEKKVNYLIQKIKSQQPVNERFYLKRTKGAKQKN